jgi:CheY-like chemotaxis protein
MINEKPTAFKYRCVMVIDDTYADRFIAERGLKKYNIAEEIICKESAADALDYLKLSVSDSQKVPQVILLDIRMPGMDGFGFLEEYERLPSIIHQQCNIVMVSSSVDPEDHERISRNRFVTRFIGKPFIIKSTADL